MAVSVTLNQLLQNALTKISVIGLGESVPQDFATQGLIWANEMIDAWGLEPGTIPFERRDVYPLVAGKGAPATPYTIGPSGDFDTVRPEWITGAGLLQLGVSPSVELPRDLLTDRAYQAIAIKDLQSEYFTSVYYNATYPLGTIFLYPVPNTAINSLVLYSDQPIATFASLTQSYVFPPGYALVIEDNLALTIGDAFGSAGTASPMLTRRAGLGLSHLKRANNRPVDLAIDPALTQNARRPWNILSDS